MSEHTTNTLGELCRKLDNIHTNQQIDLVINKLPIKDVKSLMDMTDEEVIELMSAARHVARMNNQFHLVRNGFENLPSMNSVDTGFI